MKKTRTQLRGICPVCGGLFATKDGRLVSHGYTLKFGFQSGACHGVTAPHYGHKDCPDWIKSYQSHLKEFEAETRQQIESGVESKVKRKLQRSLSGITYMQELLEERLEKWQEVALIEVDLEVEEAEYAVVELVGVITFFTAGLGWIFYQQGGKIQEIVLDKKKLN